MSDKSSTLTSVSRYINHDPHIYLAFKLFSPVEIFMGTVKFEDTPEGLKLHEEIVNYLLDREIVITPSSKDLYESVRDANLAHIRNNTSTGANYLHNYTAWALSPDLPEVIDIFKQAIRRVIVDNKGLTQ